MVLVISVNLHIKSRFILVSVCMLYSWLGPIISKNPKKHLKHSNAFEKRGVKMEIKESSPKSSYRSNQVLRKHHLGK